MSRILRTATLLALLGVPAWAGGLGVAWSTWDTSDASDDQGLGVRLELDMGEKIDLELRTAWFDNLDFVAQGRAFELEAMPVDLGVACDFAGGMAVQPYIGGGLSFVFLNGSVSGDTGLRVDDEAGWYVVAGVEGGQWKSALFFAEVLYRDVRSSFSGDGLSRDIVDFGFDLSGVGANVGIAIGW